MNYYKNRVITCLLIFGVFLALIACENKSQSIKEPIANKISKYIQNNCKESIPCQIKIKEVVDFSWDKLYYFDMRVEEDAISNLIGEKFSSSSPYYSNKLFFMLDDKVVKFEQHIMPEVDNKFHNGDVDFDYKNSQNDYAVFNNDSKFEVEKIKLADGEFYRLSFVNCE